MKMNELSLEAAELKEKIRATIHHHYICQYIEPPVIDEDKLLFLCSIARKTDRKYREDCVISAMLVQIALDIHERILLIDQRPDYDDEIRQLTVLAGDYYSSLYYERLSNLRDITLIRLLANGIKEINEHKMNFFYAKQLSTEQLINCIRVIESGIVRHFARAFQESHFPILTQEFFLLKRLLKEKKQLLRGQLSQWLHIFSHHLVQQDRKQRQGAPLAANMLHKATVTIDAKIATALQKITPLFEQSANEKLVTILNEQLTQYLQSTSNINKQLAEEG